MAYTYSKIATYTMGSTGSTSVDFLNIPQTYTDLLILVSARTTRSAFTDPLNLELNGSNTNDTAKDLESDGSAVVSGNFTTATEIMRVPSASSTASTFGNGSIYIPNYTSSNYKSSSGDSVTERNATTESYIKITAGLWSNTSPVTSIRIASQTGNTFVQYSTFHLYGIKAEL